MQYSILESLRQIERYPIQEQGGKAFGADETYSCILSERYPDKAAEII